MVKGLHFVDRQVANAKCRRRNDAGARDTHGCISYNAVGEARANTPLCTKPPTPAEEPFRNDICCPGQLGPPPSLFSLSPCKKSLDLLLSKPTEIRKMLAVYRRLCAPFSDSDANSFVSSSTSAFANSSLCCAVPAPTGASIVSSCHEGSLGFWISVFFAWSRFCASALIFSCSLLKYYVQKRSFSPPHFSRSRFSWCFFFCVSVRV